MWGLGKKITTTTVTNTHLRNTLSSWNGASFSASAGRDLTLQGTQVNAGGIDLRAGNDLNVLAVFDVDEMSHIKSVVNKGLAKLLGQDSSDNYYDVTRKALLPSLNAGGGALSFVAGNTLTYQAPRLTAGSIYYEANHINDMVAKDFRQVEETHTRKNLLWQSTDSVGYINEVAHMSQLNVPKGAFHFKAPGGITVQLPAGSALREQIERMAAQPGQEYLKEFANRDDIDWQRIEVVNKTWDIHKEGMTPEAGILLNLALAWAIPPGLGAELFGNLGFTTQTFGATGVLTGFTTSGVMANTAMTTFISQVATSVINNKGDLSAVFKELGSGENVRTLVIAVATAGALDKIGDFKIPTSGNAFVDKVTKSFVNKLAGNLISTAVNGGNIEDAFKNALTNALIDSAGSSIANKIGDFKADGSFNDFAHKLAHAALGCALGSAASSSGSACATGAAGAVVGEIVAEYYGKNTNLSALEAALEKDKTNQVLINEIAKVKGEILQVTQLVVASTSLLAGGDASQMNLALRAANNSVANNFLLHTQAEALKEELKKCASTNDSDCEKLIIEKYRKLSSENIRQYQNCVTGGDTECIKIFNTLAAKPQEFNDANLDSYALNYFVEKAKQVQNGTVFTSGNYSKLGSDLQQAEKFKVLRNDFCGTTVLTDQCNQFFKDLKNAQNEKDVQLFIGGLLTAAGGPIAANILLTTGRVTLQEAAIIAREGLINYCRANQIACINYTDVIMGTLAGATIPSVLPAFGSLVTKTLAKLEATGVAKLEALGVAKLEELGAAKLEALGAQELEKTIATCAAPPACFVAGTMVQTPNGLKAIETFKPGDLVYSKDQFTQAPGVRPVVATKQTLDQLLYEVVVKNAQGQTETYTTTSEHPFWVTNGPANGQWLKASFLQAGLHLTNAQGETLEVVSQTALEKTATVYNIQVHEHSTYHVGEMGVWVHNANCCDVDSYKELKSTEKVGDNLEHDHIPSAAALFRNMENQLGRPLTTIEKNELYNKATAIEVPKQVHKQSPTYGGKNTKAQIQNDALDLEAAILRDTEATKTNLINWGLDPDLVNARIKQVIERNKKLGVIK